MRMTFGREALFGYIKAERQPVFWFNSYAAETPTGLAPEAYAAQLRALHRTDPQANRDIWPRSAASSTTIRYTTCPSSPVWHRGHVVLVGDAAHAVGPHAGQGASMAIEDAVVLAACLDENPTRAPPSQDTAPAPKPHPGGRSPHRAQASQKRSSGRLSLMIRNLILPFLIPLGIRAAPHLHSGWTGIRWRTPTARDAAVPKRPRVASSPCKPSDPHPHARWNSRRN